TIDVPLHIAGKQWRQGIPGQRIADQVIASCRRLLGECLGADPSNKKGTQEQELHQMRHGSSRFIMLFAPLISLSLHPKHCEPMPVLDPLRVRLAPAEKARIKSPPTAPSR